MYPLLLTLWLPLAGGTRICLPFLVGFSYAMGNVGCILLVCLWALRAVLSFLEGYPSASESALFKCFEFESRAVDRRICCFRSLGYSRRLVCDSQLCAVAETTASTVNIAWRTTLLRSVISPGYVHPRTRCRYPG